MSRCFPYPPPPPYYEEGLIESIKLQKEREKAKKERRKEKKKEKKEKREKAGHENSQHTAHIHKKRKCEEWNQLDQKDGSQAKATADAVEQLEKSALTEEHEQPFSIQNAYYSSESSQDSGKRRKLVATNASQDNHGSILRIRLPLVKQKDPTPPSMPVVKQKDPAPPACIPIVKQKKQLPPARLPIVKQTDQTPPSANIPIMKQRDLEPPAAMPTVKQKDLKPCATVPTLNQTDQELSRSSEEPCFSGRIMETDLKLVAAEPPYIKSISKRNRRMREMERQFRDLLINWNPPPLQLEDSDIGNQDWLFGSSRRRSSPEANRCQASTEGLLSHGSYVPSLQPQACYLPEFDMYQLPYAIPY